MVLFNKNLAWKSSVEYQHMNKEVKIEDVFESLVAFLLAVSTLNELLSILRNSSH